jgi:hypothetical protein
VCVCVKGRGHRWGCVAVAAKRAPSARARGRH